MRHPPTPTAFSTREETRGDASTRARQRMHQKSDVARQTGATHAVSPAGAPQRCVGACAKGRRRQPPAAAAKQPPRQPCMHVLPQPTACCRSPPNRCTSCSSPATAAGGEIACRAACGLSWYEQEQEQEEQEQEQQEQEQEQRASTAAITANIAARRGRTAAVGGSAAGQVPGC